jgi:hypothetical protein
MTYSLGPLSDDPTQERILLEVIENPAGYGVQVQFCLDVVTVPNEGVEINCDGMAWYLTTYRTSHPGEHPTITYRGPTVSDCEREERIAALKASGTYRPTLHQLLREEDAAAKRRERNAEWMRRQRAEQRKENQPVACIHCGSEFTPKRSTAQFCSTRCRVAAHRATHHP